ncbi:hypothetical protein COCHEDRAFT_1035065 [Bipolaris maydis C5]|uniref:Uncharacterized protein n=2 Tax=Cochliobolus heterostrophus TaxID=5016 RepID=M2UDN3_COCH5|nr:hypothetical protein COCHEDRAFT_1035065 [Bipolaris maydis C5]KAJ5028223.1 hypothetical protein J3E73DRAFT_409383 [Bipolaris maydis]KAJ6203968.1 hypothetical protein PSV09DRAFT_1035065 [Bipolaris maydis]KAJ6265511.1 hypothetical protein PSV08DRAFT_252560 [Bipolaris maydis]
MNTNTNNSISSNSSSSDMLPPPPFYKNEEASGDSGNADSSAVQGPMENSDQGDVSAGMPKDTELQLVLRNAHSFQDASLPLAQRVDAFKQFAEEVKYTKSYWQNRGDERPMCGECGKKHYPPHVTKEQQAAVAAAFKQGKALGKELNRELNRPRSRPQNVTRAGCDDGTPRVKKPRAVFCENCAKWHPGGKEECNVPLCPLGCGRHHLPIVDCNTAAKRFSNIAEARKKPAATTATTMATVNRNVPEMVGIMLQELKDDHTLVRDLGDFLVHYAEKKKKSPEDEAASVVYAAFAKKQKKKTGRGSSCQKPQHHRKGPPKPDDKGEGNATHA